MMSDARSDDIERTPYIREARFGLAGHLGSGAPE